MKRWWLILLIICCVLGGVIFVISRGREPKIIRTTPVPTVGQLKGVSFSPQTLSGSGITDFYARANQVGNTVTWAGDWQELNSQLKAPYTIAKAAKQSQLEPVIITTLFTTTQNRSELLRPLTEENLTMYRDAARLFAQTHQPRYMGIGIEVNRLAHDSPQAYAAFTTLFANTVRDIKAVSPSTQVFTVFQLENLKGRWDGLYGGTRTAPAWDLLADFPDADLFAFTTYPYLIYKSPVDLPDDYYTEIARHTTKPLAFTEIGWPSETVVANWESSLEEQADFITRFKALTDTLELKIVIWPFLYDQDLAAPFKGLGLRSREGQPKPALETWQNF